MEKIMDISILYFISNKRDFIQRSSSYCSSNLLCQVTELGVPTSFSENKRLRGSSLDSRFQ